MWQKKKIKLRTIWITLLLVLIIKSVKCSDDNLLEKHSNLTASGLKDYLTQLLSQNISTWKCPAPVFPLQEKQCHVETCDEKQPCLADDEECCFNGCVFTCLKQLTPPPVIDWELEPFHVKENENEVRHCLISPRPAPSEPVGCPKGFECQVIENSMSSRGICVPVTTTVIHNIDVSTNLQENTAHETVYLPGGCTLSKTQYLHVQDFRKKSFVINCFCKEGSVLCQLDPSQKNSQNDSH